MTTNLSLNVTLLIASKAVTVVVTLAKYYAVSLGICAGKRSSYNSAQRKYLVVQLMTYDIAPVNCVNNITVVNR